MIHWSEFHYFKEVAVLISDWVPHSSLSTIETSSEVTQVRNDASEGVIE